MEVVKKTTKTNDSEAPACKFAYVYILECSDGSLYTGWTYDPDKRLKAHNAGTASKCTRSRLPVKLVYTEQAKTRGEALSREAAIKKLDRRGKLELIACSRSI
jgi:putative endonuclease